MIPPIPLGPIIKRSGAEVKKRPALSIQTLESKKRSQFLYVAEALGLVVADRAKIRAKEIKAG